MQHLAQYRKTLKLRVFVLSALMLVTLAVALFGDRILHQLDPIVLGFLRGVCIGGEGFACIIGTRYRKALHSDDALQRMYNAENDERMKAIRAKAGVPVILITSVCMLLAAVVAGHFNLIVFYTLAAAALAQLLLSCGLKLFYLHKL